MRADSVNSLHLHAIQAIREGADIQAILKLGFTLHCRMTAKSPFYRMLRYAPMTALRLARPTQILGQFEIFLLFGLSDSRWPDQEVVE